MCRESDGVINNSLFSCLIGTVLKVRSAATFNPGFKIALHQKDLNLALQSAKALALNLPNTATCQELFNTCAANGGSQLDHSALVQALELMANHKLA